MTAGSKGGLSAAWWRTSHALLIEYHDATTVRVMGGIIAHGPQIRIATTIMVGQTAVAVFKLPGKSGEHSMLTQTHSNLHDSKI